MRLLKATFVVALLAAYLFQVFQVSFFRVPDAGLADWMDPYFINFLLEHWYQSLRTFSDPATPPVFFPITHTLSYSHALILYVPFYVVPRLFLHPFQAYTVMLILVMASGTLCLYVIFRRHLRLSFVEALLFCALFQTSHNIITGGTSVWSQTASVFLVPPILLLGLTAAAIAPGRARLVLAGVTGLLAVLLFAQDFYTGVFVLLIGGLALVGVLVVNVDRVVAALARVVKAVVAALLPPPFDPRRHAISKWWTMICVASLLMAAIVFVYPIDRTDFGLIRFSVRDPMRPFLLGIAILGWLVVRRYSLVSRTVGVVPAWFRATRMYVQEPQVAFSLAGIAGGLIGAAFFVWLYLDMYLRHPVFPAEQLWNSIHRVAPEKWVDVAGTYNDLLFFDSGRPFLLIALLLAVMACSWQHLGVRWKLFAGWFGVVAAIIFVLPLGFGGWSMFETFITPLPGLGVVRDPKRVIYVFELAAALVSGVLLMRLDASRWPRRVTPVLLAGLLWFTWTTITFRYDRPLSAFREWVERPIAIDTSCKSFFMKPASVAYTSRSSGGQWTLYAVDAGFVAFRTSLPTLNGYSAWTPEGWGGLANPRNEEYLPSVREWIRTKGLTNVCELDIERRTMRRFE